MSTIVYKVLNLSIYNVMRNSIMNRTKVTIKFKIKNIINSKIKVSFSKNLIKCIRPIEVQTKALD